MKLNFGIHLFLCYCILVYFYTCVLKVWLVVPSTVCPKLQSCSAGETKTQHLSRCKQKKIPDCQGKLLASMYSSYGVCGVLFPNRVQVCYQGFLKHKSIVWSVYTLLRRGSLGEGAGKKEEKEGVRGTTGRRKGREPRGFFPLFLPSHNPPRGMLLSPIFTQSILWKEASAEERGVYIYRFR